MAALVLRNVISSGRQQVPCVVGVVCIQRRDQSTNLATIKRGRGGRSSFSGVVATVFGASGFLGRYVLNRLGKIGSQVIVPYRGDPYDVGRLKMCGDLGQILFLPYSLRDEDSVRKAMKYSNVVINLVGRDFETRNFKFNDVHQEGARMIARLARECGVSKLIHFSSLNASTSPQEIYLRGGSRFLTSKALGEEAVREEFPEATIFRPADMYGAEDRFIRYYADMWRRGRGTMPMWKRGLQTIKQPVFISDVAAGVVAAVRDPDSIGQTYEAVGPSRYYLYDLVDYFYRCMRYTNFHISHLTPLFRMKAYFLGLDQNVPILHMDKLEREHVTDVLTPGCLNLEDLGVKLTRLEDRAMYELKPFRLYSYYEDKLGEFADPIPPEVTTL